MNPSELIPQDKFDTAAVRRARMAGYPGIAPIIPDLLEWLQDGNWPVADEMASFLAEIGSPMVPHILPILRGDDCLWKYWVLVKLVPRLDPATRRLLAEECARIANHPTKGEAEEEVDLAARNILSALEEADFSLPVFRVQIPEPEVQTPRSHLLRPEADDS